jgi:hypothetical protein
MTAVHQPASTSRRGGLSFAVQRRRRDRAPTDPTCGQGAASPSATSATWMISMTRMTWTPYALPVLRASVPQFFQRWTCLSSWRSCFASSRSPVRARYAPFRFFPFLDIDNPVPTPFGGTAETESANGSPYLEVHHVIPLAEGGADAIWNAVAICANCHARCHHGRDRNEFTTRLYNLVPQLRLPTNSRDAVVD